MKINKITTGFVIQTFDTDTGNYTAQEFVAGDPVEYETTTGEISDSIEEVTGKDEPYLPFEMVQPSDIPSFKCPCGEDH